LVLFFTTLQAEKVAHVRSKTAIELTKSVRL